MVGRFLRTDLRLAVPKGLNGNDGPEWVANMDLPMV